MTRFDFDIIVVGAGSVGLAFAAAMRESGYRILILDSGGAPRFDDSSYDLRVNTLNLASETFLNAVGAWSNMQTKRVSSFDRIKVWDSAGGRIQFLADEIGEQHLGHVVEAGVVTTSLIEAIEGCADIELRFDVHLQSVTLSEDRVEVILANNERISSLLVVGTDGGNSTVRESIGFDVSISSYDQRALVAQVEASEPASRTAFQVFLPTGPLAFLPLADGSYSIVWSAATSFAAQLMQLTETGFEQKLSAAVDYELGDLSLISQLVSFQLRKLEAEKYFFDRVVLAGDSAHIIHPLAGMGVNLGLMDAAVLSEVLLEGESDSKQDPFQVSRLRQYQRWRKSSNVPTAFIMDGFDWGFRHPSKLIQTVLGAGLTLTNRMDFPKQEIIRFACGLKGDLPSIARRV
ncbi:MAG: NAD(P)-binding protein [Gammaproteobacteria bacterium]|nr:NAD(P)-binding protein [Gammaproteobacteria bacterium]